MSWDDLLTLSVLARERAWGPAAKALALTRNTVIRRIRRLELALGLQLILERESSLALTAEGERVLATAREMHDLANALSGAAADTRDAGLNGLVRLTAPEGVAAGLIAPALGALRARHPLLEIELLADAAVLSISRKEADVAVRLAAPQDGNLVALRAGTLRYALFASGAADPAQAGLPLVAYDASGDAFPESALLRRQFPQAGKALRSNSLLAQRAAIAGGAGAGLLPLYLGHGLHQLGPVLLEKPVYIVFHGQHRHTPRIRAVTGWLRGVLETAL